MGRSLKKIEQEKRITPSCISLISECIKVLKKLEQKRTREDHDQLNGTSDSIILDGATDSEDAQHKDFLALVERYHKLIKKQSILLHCSIRTRIDECAFQDCEVA
ncbi:hypothetical protein ISN44_As11g034850 [Arabidopsis suecica]|uniref:Uncharacterized protein n=1 Tax=Arabidopsis suecica TaxID=45249 RepID=A0A8T1ZFS1_ARASU|nr:hypothetical protein ISN44_As11g034850 [Arabidopsis suecica]